MKTSRPHLTAVPELPHAGDVEKEASPMGQATRVAGTVVGLDARMPSVPTPLQVWRRSARTTLLDRFTAGARVVSFECGAWRVCVRRTGEQFRWSVSLVLAPGEGAFEGTAADLGAAWLALCAAIDGWRQGGDAGSVRFIAGGAAASASAPWEP